MTPDRPVPKTSGGRLASPAAVAAFCLHLAAAAPLLMAADALPSSEPVTVEFIVLEAPPAPSPPLLADPADMPLPAPPPEAMAPPSELAPPPEPEPLPQNIAEPAPKPAPAKPVAPPKPAPRAAAIEPPPAAAAAVAPALAPSPSRAGGVAADSYLAALLRHLQAFRDYPYAARRTRQQGRVVVLVALQGDGAVASASVEQSSGHELLDQAALAMVRRASPFPPPPAQAPRHLRFPVDYSLQR